MNTDLSEKDKTELVKFIDDVLYFNEGKADSVIIPFRGFALSEKYEDLEEMQMEAELLIKKLGKLSGTAIKKQELQVDTTSEEANIWGISLEFDRSELQKIRSELAA